MAYGLAAATSRSNEHVGDKDAPVCAYPLDPSIA
jgi:hypothetical protein